MNTEELNFLGSTHGRETFDAKLLSIKDEILKSKQNCKEKSLITKLSNSIWLNL